MSAFAVIFDLSNAPVEPGALENIMTRLQHRGPDGSNVLLAGNAALGHWHFWTTPEEVGERQPLQPVGMPFTIVLDGRLDNRSELLEKLNISPIEGKLYSDATLVLHAYARWGDGCFEHFIGEFALVILDEQRGELLCARDALGDRTLFYSFHGTRLVIASEPGAVAAAEEVVTDIDEVGVAYYFAVQTPPDGRTLFKGVRELLPAQAMQFGSSGQRSWRFWQANPDIRVRYKSDEEYAEHFRCLLEQSVRCRLRSTPPAGILMSGGLDSTSVACLSASMLAPSSLTTLSYVFDELPDCDERLYINAVEAKWGTRSIQIPCDDLWPFRYWPDWPRNPNHPEGNFYRLIKERTYLRAQKEGLRVLLTGGFGDQLYSRVGDWMADLVADGQLGQIWRELVHLVQTYGLRKTLELSRLRRVARRLLEMTTGWNRPLHSPVSPRWLTPFAAGCLVELNGEISPLIEQQGGLIGLRGAQSYSREAYYTNRHALELRHPYRDRRLVEFMLAIPASQFFHHGLYKFILRNAMQGFLPEVIRTRPRPTSMESLYKRGRDREKNLLQSLLDDPESPWRKYVAPNWLSKNLDTIIDGSEGLVPWLCISYETWYNYYENTTEIL